MHTAYIPDILLWQSEDILKNIFVVYMEFCSEVPGLLCGYRNAVSGLWWQPGTQTK